MHIQRENEAQLLEVDTIIICAGQLSNQTLFEQLQAMDVNAALVGGAYEAAELDAKAAINQASYLAAAV